MAEIEELGIREAEVEFHNSAEFEQTLLEEDPKCKSALSLFETFNSHFFLFSGEIEMELQGSRARSMTSTPVWQQRMDRREEAWEYKDSYI